MFHFPNDKLLDILESAWASLCPDTEEILAGYNSLPKLVNSNSLPYLNDGKEKLLFILHLPKELSTVPKLKASNKHSCLLCSESLPINQMRPHVGQHILYSIREIDNPKDLTQDLSLDPCGWCGLEGCLTQLRLGQRGSSMIESNCIYHWKGLKHKDIKEPSEEAPCTNIPIHCLLCPKSITGQAKTVWKYNAVFHLISEHASVNGKLPSIPPEMLLDMFIRKAEETYLGISEEQTIQSRNDLEIPNSDGLLEIEGVQEEVKRRDRSHTVTQGMSKQGCKS